VAIIGRTVVPSETGRWGGLVVEVLGWVQRAVCMERVLYSTSVRESCQITSFTPLKGLCLPTYMSIQTQVDRKEDILFRCGPSVCSPKNSRAVTFWWTPRKLARPACGVEELQLPFHQHLTAHTLHNLYSSPQSVHWTCCRRTGLSRTHP
jgi:hypothetical protein